MIDLLLQLGVTTILIVIVTVIHGTGVAMMDRLFQYEDQSLRRTRLAVREVRLMVPMALCLFALHTLEISVFALFYLATGDIGTFADALYASILAYTTLGTLEGLVDDWPIVVALEGLVGFLMIGWSAAVFVTDMDKVLRRRRD